MNISGRNVTALIYQNLGNGELGTGFNLSPYILDLGSFSWVLDDQLTKINPGSCSLKVAEESGYAIWNFISDNISISGGLLPPWLIVYVDNVKVFVGLVDLSGTKKEESDTTYNIVISAQDWSVMLSKINLDWTRPKPKIKNARTQATLAVTSSTYVNLAYGYSLLMGMGTNVVYLPSTQTAVELGDLVTVSGITGTFPVIGLETYGSKIACSLGNNFSWPSTGHDVWYYYSYPTEGAQYYSATLTRLATETSQQSYYVLTQTVVKSEDSTTSTLTFDTTEGLTVGDKLNLPSTATRKSSQTFTILDIDPQDKQVICVEGISETLNAGELFYLSDESLEELVFENAIDLIKRAASIVPVDLSRYVPATLPAPALSWLPFRTSTGTGVTGESLRCPYDIQTNLTGFDVNGLSSWAGDFNSGWSVITWLSKVIWTNQLTTAPSLLMPDQTASLAPYAKQRNESYLQDWRLRNVPNGNGSYNPNQSTVTAVCVVHDYSALRRFVLSNTYGGSCSPSYSTWNGSTWVAGSTLTWTGPLANSAVPFPSVASSLGSGASVLILDTSGNLVIKYGTSTGSLASPDKNAVLVQTPYGVYLVGQQGYGKVTWTGTALACSWVSLNNDKNISLMPNTFVAFDANNIYCFAGVQYTQDEKTIVESWLFNLTATPDTANPQNALLYSEKISNGIPINITALRHPNGTKIVGLFGGRVFQIAKELGDTIERVNVTSMNALELIEHICRVNNCIAIPTADATLAIVSRSSAGTATVLSPNVKSTSETRKSKHFFSQVSVTGSNDDIYGFATGQVGETELEISGNPLISTSSQARAIAMSYAGFFGYPRKEKEETWIYEGTGQAYWESLKPFQILNISGKKWFLMSLSTDYNKYEARINLLEWL